MRIKNLCMISAMSFALLSCSDSDDTSTPANIQGKKASITVSIKGNADTRSLAGEEAGSAEENDIKSLEFFVFNADGTYQKYFKPEDLALNNQYTFLVDAGNLTILTAVNQNLGEPSPVPSSLADFKKILFIKPFYWTGRIPEQVLMFLLGLLWQQKEQLMPWRVRPIRLLYPFDVC